MARFDLEGRRALVTGGAAGIGRAVVHGLATAGAHVLFCDLDEKAGSDVAADLEKEGLRVRFIAADVTDERSVETLVATMLESHGRLDIAVNNVGGFGAGDQPQTRVHDSALEAWNLTVALNLTSCFLCMKHELPPMRAQGGGAIVNVTSLAALRWSDGACPSYAAAKAGVIRLTEYSAVAYAASGIRVNAIAPGLTATGAVLKAFGEKERAELAAAQPMRRLIDPAETADAILWACSDQASGVTGLTIPVDGGWSAN